jgi:hypothetical protein
MPITYTWKNGFLFLHLYEWMRDDENPETGSWAHFTRSIPPYLQTFWRLSSSVTFIES